MGSFIASIWQKLVYPLKESQQLIKIANQKIICSHGKYLLGRYSIVETGVMITIQKLMKP